MSYTEREFNEAMARLDGYEKRLNGLWEYNGIYTHNIDLPDYYNDLNLLMPLAWKLQIIVIPLDNGVFLATRERIAASSDDALKAIRDCLFELAQERKG